MKYDILKCERALAVKGWTQSMLAEKCGLSVAPISRFFAGDSVRNDTAKTIITKLGLRMEDVVIFRSNREAELLESTKSRRA